ncbi:hypothetical protein CUMW_290040 [Citrus unshiu]|uniref:Uncharacterized protein n=1 Tax=Citrus unshiu TaxID=55188 RepID=A0A2H5QYZ6_CITUN|nr:hypothetical protein CUMW_290040 [Citrus unshiu]
MEALVVALRVLYQHSRGGNLSSSNNLMTFTSIG